jgi:uncharacterized membrane protein YgcG
LLLGLLVLIPTTVASGFMVNVLPRHGETWLELAIVAFFGALFGWISIGFWTAVLGFLTLVRRRDGFAITSLAESAEGAPPRARDLDPDLRTAIVMPIYDEPVDRVFAGPARDPRLAHARARGPRRRWPLRLLRAERHADPATAVARRRSGSSGVARSTGSTTSSTGGGRCGSSGRAATSPISAAAGANDIAT